MKPRERDALIEQVVSAHRPNDAYGQTRWHPAWHDLDDAGRVEAFRAATLQRTLEAALDDEGLSTTARAVLARIRAAD